MLHNTCCALHQQHFVSTLDTMDTFTITHLSTTIHLMVDDPYGKPTLTHSVTHKALFDYIILPVLQQLALLSLLNLYSLLLASSAASTLVIDPCIAGAVWHVCLTPQGMVALDKLSKKPRLVFDSRFCP